MRVAHGTVAWTVVALLVTASTVVVTTQPEFPFVRSRGRATAEFNDKQIHLVASYDYSQRNHDNRWLLIQIAMSARKRMVIERDWIALRTADDREFPLATQTRVGEDIANVQKLLQNASTRRHDTTSYFNQRDRVEDLRLFRLPFGNVVHTNFVVDNDRVAAGDLLFESPTGRWENGTYALVVRHAGQCRHVALMHFLGRHLQREQGRALVAQSRERRHLAAEDRLSHSRPAGQHVKPARSQAL